MSDPILKQAEALENLLPDALRTLFSAVPGDPFAEMPLGQMRVMRLLWRQERTPSDLALSLGVTPQAIAQVLSRLEALDLVASHSVEHDRRSKVVGLTELGRCQMANRHTARAAKAVSILEQLDPGHREVLIEALERLVGPATPPQGP